MVPRSRKVALVTGAARGIGKSIADRLARDFDVLITWNSTKPTDSQNSYRCDLAQDGSAVDLVSRVIADHGRLDVIVNNAGALSPSPLDRYDAASARQNFDVNVLAPHAILVAALPHLQPGASIVNISSINAELPPKDAVLYGASKAALNLWTKGVAKELGPRGIRVNAVAPGATKTPEKTRSEELTQMFVDLTALGRIGLPDDVAEVVAFLAGDGSRFMTGAILPVSGGYRL